ncbi:hypothetical protein [Eggerthella sp.]|uniref:hypothetical protein n=1 Tax=Eggerthellaceae TaxID=1643826 RepID=UPI00283B32E7|nr:hypothetical protein [Eggerthella sp.]MDR3847669.1 hypothetical protein [Eggerthella sp.]
METAPKRTGPKAGEEKRGRKRALLAACALLLVLGTVLAILLAGNGQRLPGSESSGNEPVPELQHGREGEEGTAPDDEAAVGSGDAADNGAQAAAGSPTGSPGAEGESPSEASETSPSEAGSGSAPPPAPSGSGSPEGGGYSGEDREWVEDVERVWVVDKAAWSETVPVYESVERSICNVCGADITGNTSAHNKQHMLAGEGSGYHSEVRQVKVGEEIVEHPEEGHWEDVVVGGHWE